MYIYVHIHIYIHMYVQKSWTSSTPNTASAVRKAAANVGFMYIYYVSHIIYIYYISHIQKHIRHAKFFEDSKRSSRGSKRGIHTYILATANVELICIYYTLNIMYIYHISHIQTHTRHAKFSEHSKRSSRGGSKCGIPRH